MNYTAIQEFQQQFRTAKDFNSKELRMTIVKAEQLYISISELTTEMAVLQQELLSIRNKTTELDPVAKAEWDAGTFT